MKHVETFFQRINIIIGSSNAAAQASVDAHTIRTFEEQHELQIDFVLHFLHPTVQIVLIAWKPVDKELILGWIGLKTNRIISQKKCKKLSKPMEFCRKFSM